MKSRLEEIGIAAEQIEHLAEIIAAAHEGQHQTLANIIKEKAENIGALAEKEILG